MERHVTDLVKKSLKDVNEAEFKMFMDFLRSLSIFGDKSPPERAQELIEIVEGRADLDAQFDVSDVDQIDRLMSCLHMAIPFCMMGASNDKFLKYLNTHIIPVLEKLPEERKLDLLKNLAESSPYTSPQDSRQLLPSVVELLKKYMPRRKAGEETNFVFAECLLYTFHHLASDRLGEDFTERLTIVEDLCRAEIKKLTQGMTEASIKVKQNTIPGLRTCNNVLAMTQPLHARSPSFTGDTEIKLSWKRGRT